MPRLCSGSRPERSRRGLPHARPRHGVALADLSRSGGSCHPSGHDSSSRDFTLHGDLSELLASIPDPPARASHLFDRRHSPSFRAGCVVVSHPNPPLIPIPQRSRPNPLARSTAWGRSAHDHRRRWPWRAVRVGSRARGGNRRIGEVNGEGVRNRGYLVFATDSSEGVDSGEYQQVYATEARTASQAIAKVRPLAEVAGCLRS